jgi:hypothetical protein
MTNQKVLIALTTCIALSPALAKADAVPMPSMVGPLAANSAPYSFDTKTALGKIYVTGAATAMGLSQSHAASPPFPIWNAPKVHHAKPAKDCFE